MVWLKLKGMLRLVIVEGRSSSEWLNIGLYSGNRSSMSEGGR